MTQAADEVTFVEDDEVTNEVEQIDQTENEVASDADNEADNLEASEVDDSESSPDTAEQPEAKITFSEEQQAVLDKIAAEKTFKLREAERKAEAKQKELEQRIAEMQRKLPQEQRPQVPDYPDRYDFDSEEQFKAAVAQRDKAVQDAIRYDARKEADLSQQEYQKRAQQMERQQELVGQAEKYTERAKQYGITPDELQQAGGFVKNYGLSEEVSRAILTDEQGPLITKYLAANVQALDALVRANPVTAGMALSQIKAEASKMKKPVSRAPEPASHLRGNSPPKADGSPKGMRFE